MEEENICIYNGTLSDFWKEEILLVVATWMNMEDNILSEIHQTQKDKCHFHLCMKS